PCDWGLAECTSRETCTTVGGSPCERGQLGCSCSCRTICDDCPDPGGGGGGTGPICGDGICNGDQSCVQDCGQPPSSPPPGGGGGGSSCSGDCFTGLSNC